MIHYFFLILPFGFGLNFWVSLWQENSVQINTDSNLTPKCRNVQFQWSAECISAMCIKINEYYSMSGKCKSRTIFASSVDLNVRFREEPYD